MKRVVIGQLGTSVDKGSDAARWEAWRPTVSLFQHEDLLIDRLELLIASEHRRLADHVAKDIHSVSPETEVIIHEVDYGKDVWDLQNVYGALHDWAHGYAFAPAKEEYLIHITTGTHISQISLFLLTEAGFLPGKLIQTAPPLEGRRSSAQKAGRYSIIDLDLSKYDSLNTRFVRDLEETTDFLKSGIPTRNRGFNDLIEQIEKVALRSRAPVLLTGPTGAGKSQLARRIYELRQARGGLRGNFVEVNCATLGGDTAASALFGHVRGSFTGAQKDRPGLLREADGGLLFLDEIGEMGLDEQAMLLRALEDKTFLPVGSDKPAKSDFQLIAGTNRELRHRVAEGRFREDLLARINLWSFALPGLAARREDIAPNLEYEVQRFSRQEGRQISFNKEAKERFLRFAESASTLWPGNFRDLNAAVTRMATLSDRGRICLNDVEEEIQRLEISWAGASASRSLSTQLADLEAILPRERLAEIDPFDRVQLAHVVAVCRRSKTLSEAGRELFAVSRAKRAVMNDADRLKKYLVSYGLKFGDFAIR